MVTLERGRRVGPSQATSIFWGLVSTFFAAAACFYFWKYHENESTANALRDSVLNLQEQRETLSSQKDKLQANISETEAQLKTREEFLQEKEAKLAQEESRLEALGAQSNTQSEQGHAQAAVVRKFNDAVRKLVAAPDTDVVLRGGRPVLRVPASVFFEFGASTLKPEGKTLLRQIAQALDGELDNFELRVEIFTDSSGEADTTATSLAPPAEPTSADHPAAAKPVNPGWALTGNRAGALSRYFRDQTSLPFQNVMVIPRADFQPIIPTGTGNHARNRRVEITIQPVPPAFRPATEANAAATDTGDASSKKSSATHSADHTDGKGKSPKKEKAAKTPATASDDASASPENATKSPKKKAEKAPAASPSDDDSAADAAPSPKKSAGSSSKD